MPLSIFARLGDIKGESHDGRHKDEIDVLSWSWGVSQSAPTGRGGGAGKPTLHALTFSHHIDSASPLLMKACAKGEHLKDAQITLRKAGEGQRDFLTVTMTDVIVTSVTMSALAEGDTTLEEVVLTFGKVDLEYTPQKEDGSASAGIHFTYDVKKNKAG